MEHPVIKDIEDKKGFTDMGRQAALVFQGAMAENSTPQEAFQLVQAYFAGLFEGVAKRTDDEKESE